MSEPSNRTEPGSKVREIAAAQRLKAMVNLRHGNSVRDAIERAEQNVALYKNAGLLAMSSQIEQLREMSDQEKIKRNTFDLRKVYLLSNDVYAMAATFEKKEITEAAYSLCELVSDYMEGAPVDWNSVDVHIDALKLLNQIGSEAELEIRKSIVDGLKKVSARGGR